MRLTVIRTKYNGRDHETGKFIKAGIFCIRDIDTGWLYSLGNARIRKIATENAH